MMMSAGSFIIRLQVAFGRKVRLTGRMTHLLIGVLPMVTSTRKVAATRWR